MTDEVFLRADYIKRELNSLENELSRIEQRNHEYDNYNSIAFRSSNFSTYIPFSEYVQNGTILKIIEMITYDLKERINKLKKEFAELR